MRVLVRVATVVVLACVTLGGAPQTPTPQGQAPPTFRAGTRVVPIYTTVHDRAGQLVLDLTAEDFEILDNGRPQALAQFSLTQAPMTGIFLIDGSSSVIKDHKLLTTVADHLIIRMIPGDRVRLASFSENLKFASGFIGDRDALLRLLANELNLSIMVRTALWDALAVSMTTLPPAAPRRVIVVFTDGQDLVSQRNAEDVRLLARRDDIMIYGIEVRPSQFEPRNAAELRQYRNPGGGFTVRPRSANRSFRDVVADTGGGVYPIDHLTELNAVATRVSTEIHTQYLLGFVPQALDEKPHTIEVRVKRQGLTARARRSYIAR